MIIPNWNGIRSKPITKPERQNCTNVERVLVYLNKNRKKEKWIEVNLDLRIYSAVLVC